MFTSQFETARTLVAMIVTTGILMTIAFLRAATGAFDPVVTGLLAALAVASLVTAIGRPKRNQLHYWRQVATVFGAGALLVAGAAGGIIAG